MNEFYNILIEWRYAFLIILFTFLVFIIIGWQKMKVLLYQLMLQAKRMAKDAILKSGQQQEDWVVKKGIMLLPLPFRAILNENTIRKIVRWLYRLAKDYADDGEINNSIK